MHPHQHLSGLGLVDPADEVRSQVLYEEPRVLVVPADHPLAGRASVLPLGDRRSTLRPDLATIPLEGVPSSRVRLATRVDDHDPLLRSFSAVFAAA